MHRDRSVSFDTHGIKFSLFCIVGIVLLYFGTQLGTSFASELIVEAAAPDIAAIEKEIDDIKKKRAVRTIEEQRLLDELREYEKMLATRSIGTASPETISHAYKKMIAADLTDMKLYLYEDGFATTTLPILSKGKRGSRWETPTGLYEVETQEIDHFSSIGEVHMPYSMQFFGNFFIHGWPTYPDGSPVPEGYSGGCIRLSTEDAQKVYAFAKHATPVFIWNSEATSSVRIAVTKRPTPAIKAVSYMVANVLTGEVYAEKGADTNLPIASLTKLITALVANETIHYGRTITVTKEDRQETEGTPGQIPPGETFTIDSLLHALLMESNNSVAYSLSRYHGADLFMQWMNDKARAIGMNDTSFEDPSGISANNRSTANDLFRLIRYIHNSQSFILNLSRDPKKEIEDEGGKKHTLFNFNHFSDNKEFIGGKTGYTDAARETMAAIFEVPIDEEKATVAIVVLGSSDRKEDIESLLSWFKRSAFATTTTAY